MIDGMVSGEEEIRCVECGKVYAGMNAKEGPWTCANCLREVLYDETHEDTDDR